MNGKKLGDSVLRWLPAAVIIVTAIAFIARLQTVQAELVRKIDLKVDAKVYSTAQDSIQRELNQIQEHLNRIEGKLDYAVNRAVILKGRCKGL